MAASGASAAPFAYIANSYTTTVKVIDIASNTVTGSVEVGDGPYGVAVNPTATRVYVTNTNDNTVSVIETAGNTVIATVPVGVSPTGIAVNPAGTRVYVANYGSDNVSVIDTASNTVVDTVTVDSGPQGVAVGPIGTRVYVTNSSSGTVSVLDAASNAVIATVGVGPAGYFGARPFGVAVSPSGTRVYVANNGTDTVAVLDTTTNTLIATAPVRNRPYGVAVNPAGTRVYVTNEGTGLVSVLDAGDPCKPANEINVAMQGPSGVALDPTGARLYVASAISNNVFVIDTATNTAITGVPVNTPGHAVHPISLGVFITTGVLPPPVDPVPPPKIRVTGIEVTQGIQDLANSVPLVSGRRTFVRVYVVSDGEAVPGVTASLTGVGTYSTIGGAVAVPLEALEPVNVGGPRITVRPLPSRSNLNDSFLFELPWRWINFETLRLAATLTGSPGPAKHSCLDDILAAPIHEFKTPTALTIQFVRLGYQSPVTNTLIAASLDEQRRSESWIRRTYPLSVLAWTPDLYLFDRNLGAAVAQFGALCPGITSADANMCAHRYITTQLHWLQSFTGFMGKADAAYGLIPQVPNDPTGIYFTRGACCNGTIGAGPSNDQDYAAHEIGHRLGRQHPVEGSAACGHSADDSNYPYFLSFIAPPLSDPGTALAGFDGGDASLLIPMGFNAPLNFFDFMGYCPPSWVSDYTYKALYTSLLALHSGTRAAGFAGAAGGAGPRAAVPQTGDWLMLFGDISPDLASAEIRRAERVDRVFEVPLRTPGRYSIRLVGAGGATLADYPFVPDPVEDTESAGGAGARLLGFGHVVPFVAGTREIHLVDTSMAGVVLGRKTVSSNPPIVEGVALQGAPDPITGALSVSWTASDLDGDPLEFDLFVTRDGGVSLQPLMLSLSGTSAQVDTSRLGGGSVQLRLAATDGILRASSDTLPFTLPNRPPQPRILTPGDRTTIHVGQLVNLEGNASDPQDGVISDAGLAWRTQQGPLGMGSRLSVTDLPVGVNEVTLTATDSLGLVASSTATVTVEESQDLPGPMLTAGPAQIGWHVSAGETQLQTAELATGNSGSGHLEFTAHSSAPWLTLGAATGTAPATITLTADPSGLAGGVTRQANVTLTAVGIPGQVITVPVRLAVGNTFVVGSPPTCSDGVDTDGDGVSDACDNCLLIPNSTQFDADEDGYGNACDPDLNGDGVVNFGDLAAMKRVFFKSDRFADLNGDNVVNFADLAIMKKAFFKKPGPSGLVQNSAP